MKTKHLLRVGIEHGDPGARERARALGAPVFVSANSMWNNKRRTWGDPSPYRDLDVALDSGGFVAMKRYGGYRWTPDEYAGLAARMAPTWWAQMDWCCEPELASDQREVHRRIDLTVEGLHACRGAAARAGAAEPMIVLQGWRPEDYVSGPAFDPGFEWPELVGVGSVCRRHLHGPTGLLAVVGAIDAKLPAGTRLHLFGVKSAGIAALAERFPDRLASTDSMAWRLGASWEAYHAGRSEPKRAEKMDFMERWYLKQRAALDAVQPQGVLGL